MKLRIGSRASRLAMSQSEWVMEQIRALVPEAELELVPFALSAQDPALDQALLDGRVDLMVHPLEELPLEQDPRLPLAAFTRRADPQDALVLRPGLQRFPLQGGVLGTVSRRRTLQLAAFYPTAEIKPAQGELEDQLADLDAGVYDGLVLSAADLKRQGQEDRIARAFHTDQLIPAVGQGILAIQCRADADLPFVTQLGDPDATSCAVAERSFARSLQGDREDPGTAHAEIHNGVLKMVGFALDAKGEEKRGAIAGRPVRAAEMGARLAKQLLG